MEGSVLVIVGEWECMEKGNWHFRVSKDRYGKCVDIRKEDSFEDVKTKVTKVFGINPKQEQPFLSFWYKGEETVFTQRRMPPVAIECDSGLMKFKKKREEKHGLTMFLTLRHGDVVGVLEVGEGTKHLENEPWMRIFSTASDDDDVRVLAAVDGAIAWHLARKGSRVTKISNKILEDNSGNFFSVSFTYKEEGFLEAEDQIEAGYGHIIPVVVKRVEQLTMDGRGQGTSLRKVQPNNGIGSEGMESGEESDEYDFDTMRNLIDKEYPAYWDPIEQVSRYESYLCPPRKGNTDTCKMLGAKKRGLIVGVDEGENRSGQKTLV